jgi:hypothetical protein
MGTFLNFILEGSLQTDKDFAIVTAFTKSATEDELKVNAGKLSADLDSFVLVHQTMFTGDNGEVVYFVEKPESMDKDEYRTIIKRVARDYGTNKYIIKRDDVTLCMNTDSPDPIKEETISNPSREYLEKLYKKFFYGKGMDTEEEIPEEEPEEEPVVEEPIPEEKPKNEAFRNFLNGLMNG